MHVVQARIPALAAANADINGSGGRAPDTRPSQLLAGQAALDAADWQVVALLQQTADLTLDDGSSTSARRVRRGTTARPSSSPPCRPQHAHWQAPSGKQRQRATSPLARQLATLRKGTGSLGVNVLHEAGSSAGTCCSTSGRASSSIPCAAPPDSLLHHDAMLPSVIGLLVPLVLEDAAAAEAQQAGNASGEQPQRATPEDSVAAGAAAVSAAQPPNLAEQQSRDMESPAFLASAAALRDHCYFGRWGDVHCVHSLALGSSSPRQLHCALLHHLQV